MPQNLAIYINRIVAIINRVLKTELTVPSMIPCAHQTHGYDGVHACVSECLVNHPIQNCSNICGAINVIMAVVFVNAPRYWEDVIASTAGISSSWLKNPTQQSSYLRKVLISWLFKQCTDISNLGIAADKESVMKPNVEIELTKERQEQEIKKCK